MKWIIGRTLEQSFWHILNIYRQSPILYFNQWAHIFYRLHFIHISDTSPAWLLNTHKKRVHTNKLTIYPNTVGARIPNIRIPNPFENRTFYCSDFECSDFGWSDHSKTEHLNIQNGRFSIARFIIYILKCFIYKTT